MVRAESRISQDELAKLSKVSRTTVKSIERGEQVSKPETLRMLADGAAIDGAGRPHPDIADHYYTRLMLAAGYLKDATVSPEPAAADLSDDEIEQALMRYFEDRETAIAFMGAARNWQDYPRAAKIHILDTLRDADRMAERSEQMQREIRARQRR